MFRTLPLIVALSATAAVAQDVSLETIGSLDGIIDGVQAAYVIVDGGDSATGWRQADDGIEVTLQAYPADTPQTDDDMLTMVLVADAASRQTDLISGTVTLTRDGEDYTATDDAIDLTVQSLEITGDSLLFTGNIRTTMAEGEADVSVLSAAGLTLSGDVQATVIRADSDAE